MVSLSTILIAALSVAAASATEVLQARDSTCGSGQGEILTQKSHVCCPGVMKATHDGTFCCYGGSEDGCGQVTCFDDLSTCKETFDVDDPNYAGNIKNKLGITVNSPGGGSSGNPGSNRAMAMNSPLLGMVAGLVALPILTS
ncbi:hypothetical protein F4677DRAFT_458262 [Hypoxylon crocopeplum]|nr:hypothetical protein F4677DRAFT_458262 [Hypoxylon crocopeplum]